MRWDQVRSLITGKLTGIIKPGRKHDKGWAKCGNKWNGPVKLGHHNIMKPHEIGGCARQLSLNEHDFKEMEACRITQETYCKITKS